MAESANQEQAYYFSPLKNFAEAQYRYIDKRRLQVLALTSSGEGTLGEEARLKVWWDAFL